ncbi:MAG: CoA-binding protein [Actinobacteria bacterium]|nr:CoA-binding protein [Actinomycetota bacterium]
MNEQEAIDQLLALPTWAIVGLSNNSERPAHRVAALLKAKGHRIVPVHPSAPEVHGERGYATLKEIPFPVDVVDLFVNSTLVAGLVAEAIEIAAKGVWLQLEVIDEAAVEKARAAGLLAVMDRCPAIEYAKQN